jgi:hypothetical protein
MVVVLVHFADWFILPMRTGMRGVPSHASG